VRLEVRGGKSATEVTGLCGSKKTRDKKIDDFKAKALKRRMTGKYRPLFRGGAQNLDREERGGE